jgi:hypothetical protein
VVLGVFASEFNRPNVAESHPSLTQLIGGRAEGVIARIDCRAAGVQREIAVPRDAVIDPRYNSPGHPAQSSGVLFSKVTSVSIVVPPVRMPPPVKPSES